MDESSTVVVDKDKLFTRLGDEAVILNLEDGVYFGLNDVGARVWELIQGPRTVGEIRDALLEEFDVEPERCTLDVLALLNDLAEHRLIRVSEA